MLQRIKWFMPVMAAMIFVAVAIPGTSEAGKKWSGADPMLTVNGELFNIRVEWPSEFDCDIDGDIKMTVLVQKGAAVNFYSESSGVFNGCEVTTKTNVKRVLNDNNIGVQTQLKSKEDFEVKTKVDRNSFWIAEFLGSSNEKFRGVINLEELLGEIVDPALPPNYNGEEYTYDDDIYGTIYSGLGADDDGDDDDDDND